MKEGKKKMNELKRWKREERKEGKNEENKEISMEMKEGRKKWRK